MTAEEAAVWPKDVARRVPFLVPEEWRKRRLREEGGSRTASTAAGSTTTCFLEYDEHHHALRVVATAAASTAQRPTAAAGRERGDEDGGDDASLLDWVYLDDAVGADIEIRFSGRPEPPPDRGDGPTTTKRTRRGKKSKEPEIAAALRASNEPASDGAADRNGTALLHLYCYPREEDPSPSWTDFLTPPASRCGTPNTRPYPSPEDEDGGGGDGTDETVPRRRRARHRCLAFAPAEDLADAAVLVDALRRLIRTPSKEATTIPKEGTNGGDAAPMDDRHPDSNSNADGGKDRGDHLEDAPSQQQQQPPADLSRQQSRRRRRRMLVILNPAAGPNRGYALDLYRETVRPMLERQAGIGLDLCVTRDETHACRRLQERTTEGENGTTTATATTEQNNGATTAGVNDDGDDEEEDADTGKDLSEYDALVVMGGDGTMHQCVQAILGRGSADYDDDDGKILDRNLQLLRTLPVALIGCGSANGFTATVLRESRELYDPVSMCYLICKGFTRPVDLARYETSNHSYTGFLTFAWAMVADIDIESECLGWLGEARFDVWAVLRIVFLRHYRARFSYLPAAATTDANDDAADTAPPLSEAIPNDEGRDGGGWKTIEDDFVVFWASNAAHAASKTLQSPDSRLNDGVFRIWFIRRGMSLLKMIRNLIAVDTGDNARNAAELGGEWVVCRTFRLEPVTKGSFNVVDGEVVEDGPVQARVLPGRMLTFANPLNE